MTSIVVAMIVIVAVAAVVVVYVAFPHRGERLPVAPALGDAMRRSVDALPTVPPEAADVLPVDELSGGRCVLGLGASGPQVIEGFHGVPYDAPIQRTREVIDICRSVWRRDEPVVHDGKKYQLPLPALVSAVPVVLDRHQVS